MVKRKKYKFKNGYIYVVEEYHDGNYGNPGGARVKKAKPTEEQMRKVNAINKAKRCQYRLLEYFNPGDCFVTLTYRVENRPQDMEEAKKDFKDVMKKIRKEYKKQNREVFWIRNIERGTKGAWHIHLVINETGNTASVIQNAWTKGRIHITTIKNDDKIYDEDFTKLSQYMTKDEHTVELKSNGEPSKPRLKQTSYYTSKNMPLPEPDVDKLQRWKKEPKPKKGYVIVKIHEGINPATGFKYRRYTMVCQYKPVTKNVKKIRTKIP